MTINVNNRKKSVEAKINKVFSLKLIKTNTYDSKIRNNEIKQEFDNLISLVFQTKEEKNKRIDELERHILRFFEKGKRLIYTIRESDM